MTCELCHEQTDSPHDLHGVTLCGRCVLAERRKDQDQTIIPGIVSGEIEPVDPWHGPYVAPYTLTC